jgi:hypothetical protein
MKCGAGESSDGDGRSQQIHSQFRAKSPVATAIVRPATLLCRLAFCPTKPTSGVIAKVA